MGSPGRALSHVFHILRRSELSATVRSLFESRQTIFTNVVASAVVGLCLRPCSVDHGTIRSKRPVRFVAIKANA